MFVSVTGWLDREPIAEVDNLGTDQNLTRVAMRGMVWALSGHAAVTAMSLIAQIVLGWYLSQDDFGVYALAIGLTNILQVCRDGGAAIWLARQPPDEFRENSGPAFWTVVFLAALVTAAMLVVAPLAAGVYQDRTIAWLILISALATPLEAVSIIPIVDLQVHMRFAELAKLRALNGLVRHGLAVLFAILGFGPFSFVIPVVMVAVIQATILYVITKIQPWRSAPTWNRCRGVLRQSGWALAGTLANAVFRQVDYLALGLVATTNVVGIYFFAYQLSIQPILLLSQNLRRIVLPTFSRVQDDPPRRTRAALRGITVIAFLSTTVTCWIALSIELLERFIWNGLWADATSPVRALCVAMPFHLLVLFARMVIQSTGKFQVVALTIGIRGMGLGMVVLLCGRSSSPSASGVAVWVATYLILSGLIEAVIHFRQSKIPVCAAMTSFLAPYVFISASAMLVHWAASNWLEHQPNWVQLAGLTVLFFMTVGIGCRLVFARSISELGTLARQFAAPARRVEAEGASSSSDQEPS